MHVGLQSGNNALQWAEYQEYQAKARLQSGDNESAVVALLKEQYVARGLLVPASVYNEEYGDFALQAIEAQEYLAEYDGEDPSDDDEKNGVNDDEDRLYDGDEGCYNMEEEKEEEGGELLELLRQLEEEDEEEDSVSDSWRRSSRSSVSSSDSGSN
jgi:hypothetical protein